MKEEIEIFKKIKNLLYDEFKGDVTSFSKHINVNYSMLRDTLKREKNLNLIVLLAIAKYYPKLDIDKFVRGATKPYYSNDIPHFAHDFRAQEQKADYVSKHNYDTKFLENIFLNKNISINIQIRSKQ